MVVGHNIRRFDLPVLWSLLGITYAGNVVDTLALAWYLEPERPRYGLATYGEDFGVPKPEVEDWVNDTLETYIHRCQEDVKINTKLWNKQWSKLKELYDNEDTLWKFLDYLDFKMQCAQKQERDKWKLDIDYTKASLEKLRKEKEEKVEILRKLMPVVPKYAIRTQPKVLRKKDGSLSAAGVNWYELCDKHKVPYDTESIKVVHHYDDPNPSSNTQIKDWLFSLGWKPRTFKHKDGRDIPQINQEHGKGICESIKDLYEIEPKLEVLDGLSVLSHRIPILEGFLDTVDSDGYVRASIQGLTNTLRFRHAHPCVNLPKPDKPYAEAIRKSLIAPDECELCGADMASLEDRLKQHYIYPYDPEYVKTMLGEGFDPHLDLALLGKALTNEEVEEYKKAKKEKRPVDKRVDRIRSIFKNGNYA